MANVLELLSPISSSIPQSTKSKETNKCHPLCCCDQCRGDLIPKERVDESVTVFSRNGAGATG